MTSHLCLVKKKNRHPRPLPLSSGASGSASLSRHQTLVMGAIGKRCVQEVRGVKRLWRGNSCCAEVERARKLNRRDGFCPG